MVNTPPLDQVSTHSNRGTPEPAALTTGPALAAQRSNQRPDGHDQFVGASYRGGSGRPVDLPQTEDPPQLPQPAFLGRPR